MIRTRSSLSRSSLSTVTQPGPRFVGSCKANNFGFLEDEPLPEAQSEIYVPKSAYGLSMGQMTAMGITGEAVQRVQLGMTEVRYVVEAMLIASQFCFEDAST